MLTQIPKNQGFLQKEEIPEEIKKEQKGELLNELPNELKKEFSVLLELGLENYEVEYLIQQKIKYLLQQKFKQKSSLKWRH